MWDRGDSFPPPAGDVVDQIDHVAHLLSSLG